MNYYDILNHFLNCNKNIKLKLRQDKNILDIYYCNNIYLSLELKSNNINDNSELIYNTIINSKNITIYIPKIYYKINK